MFFRSSYIFSRVFVHVTIEENYSLIVDKSNFIKLDESTSISESSTRSDDVLITIDTITEGVPQWRI